MENEKYRWTRATDMLPAIGSEVVVKANMSMYISRIYDEAPVDQVPDISFFFNGRHHKKMEFSSIEWLEPLPIPSSIEEEARKYAATEWKSVDDGEPVIDGDIYKAFIAGSQLRPDTEPDEDRFYIGNNQEPVVHILVNNDQGFIETVYADKSTALNIASKNKDKVTCMSFPVVGAMPRPDTSRLREKMETILDLPQEEWEEGATYGDTKFDSHSAAYGYNMCLEYVKQIASEALNTSGEDKQDRHEQYHNAVSLIKGLSDIHQSASTNMRASWIMEHFHITKK